MTQKARPRITLGVLLLVSLVLLLVAPTVVVLLVLAGYLWVVLLVALPVVGIPLALFGVSKRHVARECDQAVTQLGGGEAFWTYAAAPGVSGMGHAGALAVGRNGLLWRPSPRSRRVAGRSAFACGASECARIVMSLTTFAAGFGRVYLDVRRSDGEEISLFVLKKDEVRLAEALRTAGLPNVTVALDQPPPRD